MFRCILLTLVPVVSSLAASPPAVAAGQDIVRRRHEVRRSRRRIIFNNDGCDALYFPTSLAPTPENFLSLRTTPLADTQVDAVFYCTISAGFSNFTHRTKVGHVLTRQVADELHVAGRTNITQKLLDQGTDPLRLVVDWCHRHGKECFWSMRMNDTHDAAHRPDRPYPLFPPLKVAHPDWLIGSLSRRPPFGPWSSVDYGRPEIRDLAFRFIEEASRNYDVDGVEMDFCRHLCYFKQVAFGGEATQAQRDEMTEFVRRVRRMADAVGRKRGRPILLAVRVPDSVDYCRAVGLDLERWLREDLVDLVVGGFYFRLNPWEYLARLGHRYGVAVYAGLSESRTRGDAPPFRRGAAQSYRARAAAAWEAGVDGVYLFNFNPTSSLLRELGDPLGLAALGKVYYATVVNGNPNAYLANGKRFQHLPVVTPSHPLPLPPRTTVTIPVWLGDEFAPGAKPPAEGDTALYLETQGATSVSARINGAPLTGTKKTGIWTLFPVHPRLLKPGRNDVRVAAVPMRLKSGENGWNVVYTADKLPALPWTRDRSNARLVSRLQTGALLVADRGTRNGDYLYYSYPWNVDPDSETVVEAEVKVLSGWNNLILSTGRAYERVSLYPDHVAFYEARKRYDMDTTDRFHTYRVVLKGSDIQVFVDGVRRLDGRGLFTKRLPGRNDLRFGAANSGSVGEALWKTVKLRFATAYVSLFDLLIKVHGG